MIRAIAAAAAGLALTGCLDSFTPEVGPPARAPCADVDSDPSTPVHFRADLYEGLFEADDAHCVKCHTAGGDSPLGLLVGGLDLGSYQGLRAGGAQSGADVVIAGQPCRSVLYQKLQAGPPFGARMPLDGPPYLDDARLQLVADWIAEGAHDD